MWKPREGTEADLVEKEVERRKEIAEKKGLDTLFSKTFHDGLYGYANWIKNEKNKRSICPGTTRAVEGKTDEPDEYLEIDFGNKTYRIVSHGYYSYEGSDKYNDLTLYLNGKKVFGVSERVTDDEFGSYYSPWNVISYVNEDWVDDFKAIREHKKKIDEEIAIEFAEDPGKTAKLKEEFGIETLHVAKEKNQERPISEEVSSFKLAKRPMSKGVKFALWIIIIIFLLALFS